MSDNVISLATRTPVASEEEVKTVTPYDLLEKWKEIEGIQTIVSIMVVKEDDEYNFYMMSNTGDSMHLNYLLDLAKKGLLG